MKNQNRKLYLSKNSGGDLQSKLSSTFVANGQNLLYDFVVKKYHFEKNYVQLFQFCRVFFQLHRAVSHCHQQTEVHNNFVFINQMYILIFTNNSLKLIIIINLKIVDGEELVQYNIQDSCKTVC